MLRIEIDRGKCVGSGNCVFWASATFDLDDEGLSVVIDPSGDTEERIRVAVEGCPSKAISAEAVEEPLSERKLPSGEGSASEDRAEGGHGTRLVR